MFLFYLMGEDFKGFLSLNIVGILFGRQLFVEDFAYVLPDEQLLVNACSVGLLYDQLLSNYLALQNH